MTTYTLTGVSMAWSDTTGDGEDDSVDIGLSELKIVLQDNDTTFSYDIIGVASPGDLPDAEILGSDPYNVRLNGVEVEDTSEFFLGEIHWGTGNVTQLLGVWLGSGPDNLFVINGDPLNISSAADLLALDASITYAGEALEAGWEEGDVISFSDFAGVSVTENDRIYGDNAKDNYSGGAGKDRIWGGSNADTISGGKGNDKLFGENGKDKLSGGKGKDLLDGGTGNDTLNGGGGEDKFVFRDGYGTDLVKSFENNKDTLQLDEDLWSGTLSVSQVLDQFATRVTEGNFDGVLFSFDNEEIYVNGIGINAIGNDIEII